MNRPSMTLTSLLSGFLALLFSGVALFALFAVAQVQSSKAFAAVITFAVINLFIIILLCFFGQNISKKISAPSFIVICSMTVIYTLLQFIHLGFNFQLEVSGYILYHLILIFLYFLIIVPAFLIGLRKTN
jgi:hypothetical protein